MFTEAQIIEFTQQYHALLMRFSPENNGLFKTIATIDDAGTSKPLLLVGNAHSGAQDGECIAILNPSKDLMTKIHAGVGYTPGVLKEAVAGQCDKMFHLWFNYCDKSTSHVSVLASYESRSTRPIEVSVRDLEVTNDAA